MQGHGAAVQNDAWTCEQCTVSSEASLYRPLDASTQEIRLISIDSRSDPDVNIGVTLSSFRLARAPRYRALSYTWDGRSGSRSITIDGIAASIPQNLYTLLSLWRRRHSQSNEYIWIDQLCIDQQNETEKNSQVAIMSEIYSRAIEVVIWLWLPTTINGDVTEEKITKAANIIHHGSYKDGDDQQVENLRLFTRHPYWQRTWIVQEILLAQELQVYFSNAEPIPWDAFIDFFGEDRKYMRLNFFAREAPGQFWIEKVSLQTIIIHVKRTICQDPRDKWYGMQGLLGDKYRTVVDYGREVEEIFLDASIAIMKQTKSWDFLEDLLDLAMGMEVLSGNGKETNWFSWLDRRDGMDVGVLAKVIAQLSNGNDAFELLVRLHLKRVLRTEHMAKDPFQELYMACVNYVAERDGPET